MQFIKTVACIVLVTLILLHDCMTIVRA